MPQLYLRVLGKPELLVDQVPIDRMRTRRLWGVLAYLALSPTPISRALLAQTFWPDVDDPRVNLRVTLHQLRAEQKTCPIEDDGKFLRLADGVECDAVEFRRTLHRGQKASDRSEKRALWEIAASLERGDFLEGLDGSWVIQQRARFLYECRHFLEDLMVLQREDGDFAAAAKTAVKLLRYQIDHPEATRLALAHSDHQALAEHATLEHLLKGSLSSWPSSKIALLQALAVFPATFSEELAQKVAGITPNDLKEAVRSGIVLHDEGKLSIGAVAKAALWEKLTNGQRHAARRSHAQWMVDSLIFRSHYHFNPVFGPYLLGEGTNDAMQSTAEVHQYVHDHEEDIHTACQYCMEYEDVEHADIFYSLLCDYFGSNNHVLTPYSDILINRWDSIQTKRYYTNSLLLLARLSLREKRLTRYFYELLDYIGNTELSIDQETLQASMETALIFYHHSGEDADFDRVLKQRIELLRRLPDFPISPVVHLMVAENSLARRRFAYALLHNECYFQHWRDRGESNSLAVALLQRGAIFKGLKRVSEARSCWNEAMVLYEAVNNVHGQASCLEALASIHRENLAFGEAQILLRESIRLFRQSGDEAAVCAAEGSLGDILRDRGTIDEAEGLYLRGLEFWEKRGHTRWVKRFEERLTSLSQHRELLIK